MFISNKLNTGCWSCIKSDYVTIDMASISRIGIVHDLNKIPYPFKNNTFTEIYCKNVFGHYNYIKLLELMPKIKRYFYKFTI